MILQVFASKSMIIINFTIASHFATRGMKQFTIAKYHCVTLQGYI